MAEIPKAMIVERIRSQQGAQKANEADKELPDKVDTDTDAELLQKYGLDPSGVADLLGEQASALGQLPGGVGGDSLYGIVVGPEDVLAAKDRVGVRGHLQPVGDARGRHDALDAEDFEAAGLALLGAFHQER